MADMLRLAGGVIAVIGIAVLLFHEQIDFLSQTEANVIATVAVIALVVIIGFRLMRYRSMRQRVEDAEE